VYPDDETRFLSLRADESAEQTREVVRAQFSEKRQREPLQLGAWNDVFRILVQKVPKFRYPSWFGCLAERIPATHSRTRRDVPRFLSLLDAIALCRSHSDGRRNKDREQVEINLADYCVAYRILAEAFSSTYSGAHTQSLRVAECVRELYGIHERPITVQELTRAMKWKQELTYKWLPQAVKDGLVLLEPGTHQKNLKRYSPGAIRPTRFLPDPQVLLDTCLEVDDIVRCEDPFTGELCTLRRKSRDGSRKEGHRKPK
jgi:hypothetical protein